MIETVLFICLPVLALFVGIYQGRHEMREEMRRKGISI